MPEISANLTADAILLRSQEKVALIDGVLMRRVFFDDFDRSVAQGLGGQWSWNHYDSWPSYSSDTAIARVDGTEKAIILVSPNAGQSICESYQGFPVPRTGDLFFDFWVGPAPFVSYRPNYGFALNSKDYDGVYVYPTSTTAWQMACWASGETPYVFSPDVSTWYRIHLRWTDNNVSGKVWKRSDPEPASWNSLAPVGLNIPGDTESTPILDFYYSPNGPEPGKITNIEVWTTQASWPLYRGLFLDAALEGGLSRTRSFTVGAEIWSPTHTVGFSAAAVLYQPHVTADAIILRTIDVAASMAGSRDTFTGAQINLFDHIPDLGPRWVSGTGYQGGVLAFDGKWWAYQFGYSEMETGQSDYDISFDYLGYGAVQLHLRTDGMNAVVFIIGQAGGSWGYAGITELVSGSMSYGSNRASFSVATHPIRAVLTGNVAKLYVDGVEAFTYTVQHNLSSTRLKLANITVSGTVIDNWSFPYPSPGTRLLVDAFFRDGKVYGAFAAGAQIMPAIPSGGGIGGTAHMETNVVIRINGVDITDDVIYTDAEFQTSASGLPGLCKFRLKDMNYVYSIVVGQTLTLDINGKRVWGGWVQSVSRQFFFPYTGSPLPKQEQIGPPGDPCFGIEPTTMVPRALVIEGVDYNILFNKRFVFDKARPARSEMKSWPEDTWDSTQIHWLCENNLDLTGDGIDYHKMVEHVGTPNPDARGNPAGAGWSWADAMRAIGRYPGAIYYIDPDKRLVYTDVDVQNAGFILTDVPVGDYDYGYRDMEILYNGSNLVNDAMVWGAGQGAKRIKFKRTRDQASIDAHGLWQVGDFRGDLWRQGSIDKRSRSFVYGSPQNKRGGKDDAVAVMVTIFAPIFRVAQKVEFHSNVYGFTDVLPIRRMRITFPTKYDARFDLVLSHSIDEPWNTFEFWFPKLPKPELIIIDRDPTENCPVVNYPYVFELPPETEPASPNVNPYTGFVIPETPDVNDQVGFVMPPDQTPTVGAPTFVSLGGYFVIFGDDFDRASGQPPNGGFWAGPLGQYEPLPDGPVINSDNTLTLTNHANQLVFFDTPISSDWQIICALDLTGWDGGYGSSLDVVSPGFGNRYFYIHSNGTIATANDIYYGMINPSILRGKIYVRAVLFKGYYAAVKVWPQSAKEPFNWTWTGPASNVNNLGGHSDSWAPGANPNPPTMWGIQFSTQSQAVRLMGVSVFASLERTPASAAFLEDGRGWDKSWPFTDPHDGRVYAVAWPNESHTQPKPPAEFPYHTGGIVWGYFGHNPGGHGVGVPHYMHQRIVSIRTNQPRLYASWQDPETDPLPSWRTTPPVTIKVSGTIGFSMGRTRGYDHRGDYPTTHNVFVYFNVYSPYMDGEPFWMGDPYWRALGSPVHFGFFGIAADGPKQYQEFEFEVGVTPSMSGTGIDTQFAWGVAVDIPFNKMQEMDPRGGPFMLPNGGNFSLTTSEVIYWGVWDSTPCGSHFCVPVGEYGGSTDAKTCEGVAINIIQLHELYRNGEKWAVQLKNAYQPGSVGVTVDGTPAKPALDYIESSPQTGVITFLNSFYSAKEMTVCYFPEIYNEVDEPTPPYVPPGGAR